MTIWVTSKDDVWLTKCRALAVGVAKRNGPGLILMQLVCAWASAFIELKIAHLTSSVPRQFV